MENIERQQGESRFRHMVRLCVDKLNKENDLDWSEIVEMFELNCSSDHLRKKSYAYKEFIENEEVEKLNEEESITYKESTEIMANGSYKSDKLIKMSATQEKDPIYLLKAHGFSEKEWDLVSARNNIWNVYSKQDGVQCLYSSKITVKPKVTGFDVDKFLESAKEKIVPEFKHHIISDGDGLLEIPLFDMHFGVNTYENYLEVRDKIITKIRSKKWDTIFFILGQDLLHNSDFYGRTASGTVIEKVDMTKAWEDAFRFYVELITVAQNSARQVECSYSIANHDESMSWAFVKTLEVKFPEVSFDTETDMRKAFVWNDVFIGYSHGHKGANRIHENFFSDFGKLMAGCKVVEVHTGHLHAEAAKDKYGILVRTLSTKGKTDDWHQDNGFVGSHKRFQMFEYSPFHLEAIYYI
ncbi:hypothetical protein LCM23_06250 [Cytobacillus kochii]|uniref:hypothetical protein n=1 Tax=Cytobacillus kochii TaxID=859143 RepID=UPI001CD3D435|nr:hypothetical protein [Cytobacillus kochii]MCA1025686.1 hypothetical protein [Cytobacillus kochii]